jgi:rod shape-determining protein MreB
MLSNGSCMASLTFVLVISKPTGIPLAISLPYPLTCVARGGGIVLEMISQHDIGFLSAE